MFLAGPAQAECAWVFWTKEVTLFPLAALSPGWRPDRHGWRSGSISGSKEQNAVCEVAELAQDP